MFRRLTSNHAVRPLVREWLAIRASASGQRFHQTWQRRRESSVAARLALTIAGVCLIALGLLMLIFPGPGLVAIIVGAALVASSLRPLARGLDTTELAVVRRYRRIPEAWRRSWWGRSIALLFVLGAALIATLTTLFVTSRLFSN